MAVFRLHKSVIVVQFQLKKISLLNSFLIKLLLKCCNVDSNMVVL